MATIVEQVEQEIVDAIGEVMDKYYLTMKMTPTEDGYAFWLSQGGEHLIDMNDISEQLLPISYGKVKK